MFKFELNVADNNFFFYKYSLLKPSSNLSKWNRKKHQCETFDTICHLSRRKSAVVKWQPEVIDTNYNANEWYMVGTHTSLLLQPQDNRGYNNIFNPKGNSGYNIFNPKIIGVVIYSTPR